MARKKKHEEHENLERWLISYADFITLLFATFVVLYALSQVDINDFKSLQDSITQAFASPSLTQGTDGVMDSNNSILDAKQPTDSVITPLMMEYMSQKYEDQSMEEIQKNIDEMSKSGELTGVETEKIDRGLIIRFNDDYLFKSGSAILTPQAQIKLDKVGATIGKKFILHNMRIEGHTDNQKIVSVIFPSNWELSSARASAIIRYFIARFSFMPSLFTAVGFADTRPIADNTSERGKAKNRRVEILILKNRYKAQESPQDGIMKLSKKEQDEMQAHRLATIDRIQNMSEAAKKLSRGSRRSEDSAIMLNQAYEKEVTRLSKETKALDTPTRSKITGQGEWLKPPGGITSSPTSSPVAGKTNLRSEIDREFRTVGK